MKKTAGALLIALLVLCLLITLPMAVSAADTGSQDGLEISILTERNTYTAQEEIQITVSIKNQPLPGGSRCVGSIAAAEPGAA